MIGAVSVLGPATRFPVTFFKSHGASVRDQEELSLTALAERIKFETAPQKSDLPWIKLATFGDVRTDKGSLRHDANVLTISGIEADYDGEEITFDQAVETASFAGVLALIYTSPSHTEGKPRWRILCPLSRQVSGGDRAKMMGRLNGLYRGILAGESWTLSQSYYFGAVNSNPAHRVELVNGSPIDLLTELDGGWIGKPKTLPKPGGGQTFVSGPIDENGLLDQIVSGESYHTAQVRLLGRWARDGMPYMEARQNLQDAMDAVPNDKRDNRWASRYADIDRCLEDIYGVEAKAKDQGRRPSRLVGGFTADHAGPIGAETKVQREDLPPVQLVAGEEHLSATAGERALIASGLPIFRRDKSLVRPIAQSVAASNGRITIAAGLDVVGLPALVDMLSQAVRWERWNAKEKEWKAAGVPDRVVAVVHSRAPLSALPSIAGVITTPTLRPNGSVLSSPGYDPSTRLYHVVDPGLKMPDLSRGFTRKDAEAALEKLENLLREFPFVGEIDRAVALSAVITAVVRGALPVAPMHAFRASTAGSGKSYLADVVSMIATGRPCPVMAVAEKEDETEKRLVGLLLAGFPIISLDNVNGELGGDLLCQAIERPLVRVRALGRSDVVEIENRATLLATGNALRVRGDMTRRTLLCSLDAGVERPELREFENDPVSAIVADRGAYVAAALTIVLAFLAENKPVEPTPIASFAEWNMLVRAPLLWLGCGDPAASMDEAREDDPELSELRELLGLWKEALGVGNGNTVREIDEESSKHVQKVVTSAGRYDQEETRLVDTDELQFPDFRAALLKVAGERGVINSKRMGKWLLAREGRIADGLRLQRAGRAHGGLVRWGVGNA